MTAMPIELHRFALNRRVRFTGGEGIVRGFHFEAGTWKYIVEMPLGTEPNFGRVGAETMVLLNERELRAA